MKVTLLAEIAQVHKRSVFNEHINAQELKIQTAISIIIILMQKEQQGGESNPKIIKTSGGLPKTILHNYKVVRTHLIDGIYQGFVNSSYQRDGFGILQTDQFQTFFGDFKYNRPHGVGLIIYSNGSMIYGHFKAGQIDGIALTDTQRELRVGTFKGCEMLGIGFQYLYQSKCWKMNKYHKGVAIDCLKEETIQMSSFPKILCFQSQILAHYLRFKNRQLFQVKPFTKLEDNHPDTLENLNHFYYHKLSETHHFLGAIIDNNFEGIGVAYNPAINRIIEAGMFHKGKLHGFCLRIQSKVNYEQMGFFVDGKREGIFFTKNGEKAKFVEFEKDVLVNEQKRGETIESFKRRQKIHAYRQKDFLSIRNQLDIYKFQSIFQTSESKALKLQLQKDKKEKSEKTPSLFVQKLPKQAPVAVDMNSFQMNSLVNQHLQKTSIQIMREKIMNLNNQKNSKSEKKNKNPNIAIFKKEEQTAQKKKQERQDFEDDQIAVEENPITKGEMFGYRRKKAVSFKTQDVFYYS